MPENRYDSDGWLCQYSIMLASRSGRRRNGESAGVAPPSTKWLPPPVPVWRPSVLNFSDDRRVSSAASYRNSVCATSSAQLCTGCTLTSITPGSGVTRSSLQARIARRLVAFDHDRHGLRLGGGLDGGNQLQVILQRATGGMKT